jgi:hypothetical protein
MTAMKVLTAAGCRARFAGLCHRHRLELAARTLNAAPLVNMIVVEVTGGTLLAMSAYISRWVPLVAVTTGRKGIRVATVPT